MRVTAAFKRLLALPGINVVNASQGTSLTIGENGGLTATQLGIRSFGPTTALSDLNNGDGLIVRARNPRNFFRSFARLVLEEHFDIRHLEGMDDSAEAILGYLLGGRR